MNENHQYQEYYTMVYVVEALLLTDYLSPPIEG